MSTLYSKLSTIDNYISPALVEKAVASGKLLRADTLEELVEKTGLPMEQTLVSLERYNSMCAEGNDRDYGKRAMRLFPVEKGRFLCRQVRSCHDDRSNGGPGK